MPSGLGDALLGLAQGMQQRRLNKIQDQNIADYQADRAAQATQFQQQQSDRMLSPDIAAQLNTMHGGNLFHPGMTTTQANTLHQLLIAQKAQTDMTGAQEEIAKFTAPVTPPAVATTFDDVTPGQAPPLVMPDIRRMQLGVTPTAPTAPNALPAGMPSTASLRPSISPTLLPNATNAPTMPAPTTAPITRMVQPDTITPELNAPFLRKMELKYPGAAKTLQEMAKDIPDTVETLTIFDPDTGEPKEITLPKAIPSKFLGQTTATYQHSADMARKTDNAPVKAPPVKVPYTPPGSDVTLNISPEEAARLMTKKDSLKPPSMASWLADQKFAGSRAGLDNASKWLHGGAKKVVHEEYPDLDMDSERAQSLVSQTETAGARLIETKRGDISKDDTLKLNQQKQAFMQSFQKEKWYVQANKIAWEMQHGNRQIDLEGQRVAQAAHNSGNAQVGRELQSVMDQYRVVSEPIKARIAANKAQISSLGAELAKEGDVNRIAGIKQTIRAVKSSIGTDLNLLQDTDDGYSRDLAGIRQKITGTGTPAPGGAKGGGDTAHYDASQDRKYVQDQLKIPGQTKENIKAHLMKRWGANRLRQAGIL